MKTKLFIIALFVLSVSTFAQEIKCSNKCENAEFITMYSSVDSLCQCQTCYTSFEPDGWNVIEKQMNKVERHLLLLDLRRKLQFVKYNNIDLKYLDTLKAEICQEIQKIEISNKKKGYNE